MLICALLELVSTSSSFPGEDEAAQEFPGLSEGAVVYQLLKQQDLAAALAAVTTLSIDKLALWSEQLFLFFSSCK